MHEPPLLHKKSPLSGEDLLMHALLGVLFTGPAVGQTFLCRELFWTRFGDQSLVPGSPCIRAHEIVAKFKVRIHQHSGARWFDWPFGWPSWRPNMRRGWHAKHNLGQLFSAKSQILSLFPPGYPEIRRKMLLLMGRAP